MMSADSDQTRLFAQAAASAAAAHAARDPGQADYIELEARAQRLLAVVAERSGQPAVAESHYHSAIALQEQLLHEPGAAPRRVDRRLDELVDLERGMIGFLLTQNRPRDAQGVVERSIAVLQEHRPGGRGGESLALQYQQLADVLSQLGETKSAGEAKAKADELRQRGVKVRRVPPILGPAIGRYAANRRRTNRLAQAHRRRSAAERDASRAKGQDRRGKQRLPSA